MVRFGGDKGSTIQLKAGDVAILRRHRPSMSRPKRGFSCRGCLPTIRHLRRVHEKRGSCPGAEDDPQGRPPRQGSRLQLQGTASVCVEALPVTSTLGADAYDLQRFVSAQSGVYPQVLEELSAGRKRSHWMWFVFPHIAGLGFSAMAQHFAMTGRDGATYSFRHASDPEGLSDSFDIFRPAKWSEVRECGNALGRVQLQCEHARPSCFFNSSRHRMACHHGAVSRQQIGLLSDSRCRPR
jgi:Protein of unknown function (DUF1810)